jgi:transposase
LFHRSLHDVRKFYSQFTGQVRIGIEPCGDSEWFERILQNFRHVVRVADVGLLTGRALVHTLSPVSRFANPPTVTAYVGLEPREYSSGERKPIRRLSKAGSPVWRFLLLEADIKATQQVPEMKKLY